MLLHYFGHYRTFRDGTVFPEQLLLSLFRVLTKQDGLQISRFFGTPSDMVPPWLDFA
jgi:hypothetical protein